MSQQEQDTTVNTTSENQQKEQAIRMTPELVTSADIAIKVLISAAELAFKKQLFEDMNDVATISTAKTLAEKFLAYETFKIQNYNHIIREFIDESGKANSERVTLPVNVKTTVAGFNVETYTVPQSSETVKEKYYMFLNGDLILLHPGQELGRVNNFFLFPGIPQQELDGAPLLVQEEPADVTERELLPVDAE